jgi:hypothetical protein
LPPKWEKIRFKHLNNSFKESTMLSLVASLSTNLMSFQWSKLLYHLGSHYALTKLLRVFSYNPSLKNGHYNSDFK